MASVREQQLTTDDGVSLFVTDWPLAPGVPVAGSILLLHGLGEHSGRYAHVVRFFNRCGLAVRSYDHRGHGRSGGKRGDVPDSTAILRDAKVVLDDLAQQQTLDYPDLPSTAPLLFGHSMGGLFAARFATAQMSPLRGLILSSPGLALPLSAIQLGLLKVMSTLAPGVAVPNGLSTNHLSHDPAVAPAYSNDPLVHDKISARLLTSMLKAGEFSLAHAPTLAIPTLLLVAGDDRLVDPQGSQRFFDALQPAIGTFQHYEGMYHELFNEIGSERVFADLRRWLEAQQMLKALQAPVPTLVSTA
ncbi:alpha/beta hydrolase fold family protein [Collimonas arenae]|uniref:Alpha/beta hydrolase fold family protein n=1 Tax=Collimonas arenae TaxID=279058 RepID=A0A127QE62_9BURK|nr:alpha/beta hydrolase [Collimonas arenae]AMO98460.1 alpha/beta hydrolase fold family protein [Collimonas arenae]AMP08347.1 alpha/beta hydrolase fold family protein [Collimonas arenae]